MSQALASCPFCQKDDKLLHLEHIPPKSTGNRGWVQVRTLGTSLDSHTTRERITEQRGGVALARLCHRCNSRLGSQLGTEFGSFARQVQLSAWLVTPGGARAVVLRGIFPGRIIRHMLLNFLCMQPPDHPMNPRLREVVASREGAKWDDSLPDVRLYFNSTQTYRVVPITGVLSLLTRARWVGAEVAAPGLGVVFSHNATPPAFIGATLCGINRWLEFPFEERADIHLELPQLAVHVPRPLGYGTAAEVDRWEEAMHIASLVTTASGESEAGIATLWRRRRSGRPRRRGQR